MSIDMSQFYGVFIEESREHLDDIERLLMSLSIDAPDLEDLNSIFRAAHSIKGGSGVFGFEALISVTHVMENLFDLARKSQFTFNRPVIDELLQAVDALRTLLDAYRDGTEPDWSLVNSITEKVEALLPSTAAPTEKGFGLFEEVASSEAEQGFGLFKTPVLITQEEQAFGFFDELPTNPTPSPSADRSSNYSPDKTKAPAENKHPAAAENKGESAESSSIRVDIAKVDKLVNLAGELVITQSMLNLLGADVEGAVAERLQAALDELERNTRELQESIMSIRMLPLSFVFNRFPRVVRDLSSKLGKDVDLVIEGGHTEIDKGLIERLVDPLTHLVRNSLDHGIERPALRTERGKPSTGTITLRAEQKGGNILISVIDDGGGLNRQRILDKAAEKGIDLPEHATDQQVWQLVMAAGFSTAAEVTDVSGRGVGMDVVKRNIESLGGRIEIESVANEGSVFQIRLPLTLAILDGMSVAVADQTFIIPLANIIESVQPATNQLKRISNEQMLDLRDEYWPIVRLHNVLQINDAQQDPSRAILVLIETSKTRFALLVDDLIGQQQVVIKSLERHYRRVPGVAGATIMGDGRVALILDAESLALHANEPAKVKDAV